MSASCSRKKQCIFWFSMAREHCFFVLEVNYMKEYLTISEVSKAWGIGIRRINVLCN